MYLEWQDLFDAGETTEEFEDWFSGRVADAEDRCDMER